MKTVQIYSTPTCHFCHMAKDFFKANNIPFTDYNVSADPERQKEMIDISGQMGVPVIVIDNKDLIVGFDQAKVAELLGVAA